MPAAALHLPDLPTQRNILPMLTRHAIAIFMAMLGIVARPACEAAAADAAKSRVYRSGQWSICETANFRICTLPGADEPQLAEVCESLRKHLQLTWFGKTQAVWSPRCDIVLYRNVSEYRHNLGPGSENSSGCASINLKEGRVASRRIELRADAADWLSAALPHELTHVIAADRFSRKQLPRWADEGMAILAEPEAKQARRMRGVEQSAAANRLFRAGDLFAVRDYPAADDRDAFYGQSASLVGFLIERESPQAFLNFVERGMDVGYGRALQEIYKIESTAHLQAMWHPRLGQREETPVILAAGVFEITSIQRALRRVAITE